MNQPEPLESFGLNSEALGAAPKTLQQAGQAAQTAPASDLGAADAPPAKKRRAAKPLRAPGVASEEQGKTWTSSSLVAAATSLRQQDPGISCLLGTPLSLCKRCQPPSEHSHVSAALAPILDGVELPDKLLPRLEESMFGRLATSILFQQLAGAAADAIRKRFVAACKVMGSLGLQSLLQWP